MYLTEMKALCQKRAMILRETLILRVMLANTKEKAKETTKPSEEEVILECKMVQRKPQVSLLLVP